MLDPKNDKFFTLKVDFEARWPEIFMTLTSSDQTRLRETFFSPINNLYSQSEQKYTCHKIDDLDYLKMGVLRCLSPVKSGQDFVQQLADYEIQSITPDHFFKSLKSKRRLANLESINSMLDRPVAQSVSDPFEQFEELKKWHVYAIDGHYQQAACFDSKQTNSKGELTKYATGHFFRLNLRSHHMSLLDTAHIGFNDPSKRDRKREHDISVIKRSTGQELRNHAPKGSKVMLVWDSACIDYRHWFKLKQQGVYFITVEKENSQAKTMSTELTDLSLPCNQGILSDTLVSTSTGIGVRRIIYKNPQDGKIYRYLTNETKLPSYLLVSFYKQRWDIEKIYYQFKSKLQETKSWASSLNAKRTQAIFQCLTHNLLLLLEKSLIDHHDFRDQQSKKLEQGRKQPDVLGYINTIVQRATHRTFKFIRWLRNHILQDKLLTNALQRLKSIWCLT